MATIHTTYRQRLVRSGEAAPHSKSEDTLNLVPLNWVPFEKVCERLSNRLLVQLCTPGWLLPWDDSALVLPWVCTGIAKQRLEQAITSGVLEECVLTRVQLGRPHRSLRSLLGKWMRKSAQL